MNETTQQNPEVVTTALATVQADQNQPMGFFDSRSFEHIQRVARMFSQSALVPQQFQGDKGLPNCVIALDMSARMGASPLAVMQNLYVVYGKPGWSSVFLISCINTCGRFEPLRYELEGVGDAHACTAWTTGKGVKLPQRKDNLPWTIARAKEGGFAPFVGPAVTIDMAKKEGWVTKNGSKWLTMPELMLHYRAATFFIRLYAPELTMGMKTTEEIIDIEAEPIPAGKRPVFSEVDATIQAPVIEAAASSIDSAGMEPYAQIMDLIQATAGVSEPQVLAYGKTVKLISKDAVELLQVPDSKLRELIKTWANIIPKIRAMEVTA